MNSISSWLSRQNKLVFTIYAIIAAFCTYSCMYAFRKPFAVASYSDYTLWGLDYKVILIIFQVFGYMLSKFIGIKVVSEMTAAKRAIAILIFIGFAELALLLFALVPYPYNFICLFLNGLPLGMIWGLVFSFLEGRVLTEVLGAGLCASFIVASGFVKSIGRIVIDKWGFSEFQMPFITGALFALPLVFFVWMLSKIPPPTTEDEHMRTQRVPMHKKERVEFFLKFAFGIVVLTLVYMFLTAFRDLRDNFAVEIWTALGYKNAPMIMTYSEIPIAVGVLIIVGATMLIKNNIRAFIVNHILVLLGILLSGLATLLYQVNFISPAAWMVAIGFGVYLAYVPFNCILFDRLIATYKTLATAGFLIYIADAFGYLASVGILIYKNFGHKNISWYNFFIQGTYVFAVIGSILVFLSLIYFTKKHKTSYVNT